MDESTPQDQILLGVSLNAVKIQMYFAIIAYCLVALIGYKLKVGRHLRNLTDTEYRFTGQSTC